MMSRSSSMSSRWMTRNGRAGMLCRSLPYWWTLAYTRPAFMMRPDEVGETETDPIRKPFCRRMWIG